MGMGHEIYPQASKDMRSLSGSDWGKPVDHFMAQVSKLLNDQIQTILYAVLGSYEALPIYLAIQEWRKAHLDIAMQGEWTRAEAQLAVEQAQPYTMDSRLSALEKSISSADHRREPKLGYSSFKPNVRLVTSLETERR
jgi:hypothetical protein